MHQSSTCSRVPSAGWCSNCLTARALRHGQEEREPERKSQNFRSSCSSSKVLIFGIAFGRPPLAFLKILGSCQGAFWGYYFAHLFADAAKLYLKMQPFQAKCLFWDVLGFRFCIIFSIFLHVLFMLLSRRPFSLILAVLGLQRGFLLEHVFTDFANFA